MAPLSLFNLRCAWPIILDSLIVHTYARLLIPSVNFSQLRAQVRGVCPIPYPVPMGHRVPDSYINDSAPLSNLSSDGDWPGRRRSQRVTDTVRHDPGSAGRFRFCFSDDREPRHPTPSRSSGHSPKCTQQTMDIPKKYHYASYSWRERIDRLHVSSVMHVHCKSIMVSIAYALCSNDNQFVHTCQADVISE